eukprot:8173797-Pyramimonas_sp.AAC.1
MHLSNQLVGSASCVLGRFLIPRAEGGFFLGSPFDWPLLNLAPDQGPDMVCLDYYLSYFLSMNLNVDYDISHALNNATKGALRHPRICPLLTPTGRALRED